MREYKRQTYIKIRCPKSLFKVQVETYHLTCLEVGGPLHPVVSPGELEGCGYGEAEVHRVNVVDVDQTNHRIHLKRPSFRPTVKNKAEYFFGKVCVNLTLACPVYCSSLVSILSGNRFSVYYKELIVYLYQTNILHYISI